MNDVRVLMEAFADTMSAELLVHTEAVAFRKIPGRVSDREGTSLGSLNGLADHVVPFTWPTSTDGKVKRFFCGCDKISSCLVRVRQNEGRRSVTVEAIEVDSQVQIDYVFWLQRAAECQVRLQDIGSPIRDAVCRSVEVRRGGIALTSDNIVHGRRDTLGKVRVSQGRRICEPRRDQVVGDVVELLRGDSRLRSVRATAYHYYTP